MFHEDFLQMKTELIVGLDLLGKACVWVFVEDGGVRYGGANGLIEGREAFDVFAEGADGEEVGFGLGVGEEEVARRVRGVACCAGELHVGGEGVLEGLGEVGEAGFVGGACDEEVENDVKVAKGTGLGGGKTGGFGVVAFYEDGMIGC